ncbi:NAD+ kinase protein [Halorhabdus tiamatea SARL4B]|nr:NAD(+)/NADH kinase [Halorhabdus tiamatea]ERJ05161.1 NAD+ kinase protein [Halorhabdus tiamatea SARL4B]
MSEERHEGPVTVVGDDAGVVVELVRSVGVQVVPGSPAEIDEAATAVIAVGEDAVLDLVRHGCTTPVLPVAVDSGLGSVPADSLQSAVERVRDGEYVRRDTPTLDVHVDGDSVETALADVMLVTSEPAHISEYTLSTPRGEVATFRADGVVIATPAGSRGYARRVGGAVLDSGAAALSVVPVGMFSTTKGHWTISLPEGDPAVTASIKREEAPVSLLIDDRTYGHLDPTDRLSLVRGEPLPVISLPESDLPFNANSEQIRDTQ